MGSATAEEREGVKPKGKTLTPERRRIQEREARCKKLKQEKHISQKATVAFFKMYFSVFRRQFSSRNCWIYNCSAVNFSFPLKAYPSTDSCSFIRCPGMFGLISRLRAAWALEYPCSSTRLMAPSLNSFEYSFFVVV
jgi:hypothetical protein